jgi:Cu+-exporting ATPase
VRAAGLILCLLGLSFGTGVVAPACAAPAELRTLELRVGGMVCDSCEQGITAAVTRLDGVAEFTIDHTTGRATARYDPARVAPDAIVAAIVRLGYTATPA